MLFMLLGVVFAVLFTMCDQMLLPYALFRLSTPAKGTIQPAFFGREQLLFLSTADTGSSGATFTALPTEVVQHTGTRSLSSASRRTLRPCCPLTGSLPTARLARPV